MEEGGERVRKGRMRGKEEREQRWTDGERGVKDGEGINQERGVFLKEGQTVFHIANVDLQAGLHVRSEMFTRRSACVQGTRWCSHVQDCMLSFSHVSE